MSAALINRAKTALARKYQAAGCANVWQVSLGTITSGKKSLGTYTESRTWIPLTPGLMVIDTLQPGNKLLESAVGTYKVGDMLLEMHADCLTNAGIVDVQLRSKACRIRPAANTAQEFTVETVTERHHIGGQPLFYDLVIRGAGSL